MTVRLVRAGQCATTQSDFDRATARVVDAMLGMQESINELRDASSLAELIDRSAAGARRIGFTRVLYSRIEQGVWSAQASYVAGDPAFAQRLVELGTAHSRRPPGTLLEQEMLQRGVGILVADARTNPRTHRGLVRFTGTTDYVAAPVYTSGIPAGMVHADCYPNRRVHDIDRHLLSLYAAALGQAFERHQLVHRLRIIQHACGFDAPVERQVNADFTCPPTGPAEWLAAADNERREPLSPRELDVLRNIASGMTNAQIAAHLFLTENTVKVYVKQILRKLGAANRTEAAALFHRRRDGIRGVQQTVAMFR